MNHHLLDRRAAFQRAMPFQINDQTNKTANIHGATDSHGVACGCESRLVIAVCMYLYYNTIYYCSILLYTVSMYLGIDYGSKRIGLSVSDDSGSFAMPLQVLENSDRTISEICGICEKKKIDTIIVGESKNFKQEDNEIMREIKIFVEKLAMESGLPVVLHPEFMTSAEAERLQGKNKMLDASAAAIILKSYLDTKNNGK